MTAEEQKKLKDKQEKEEEKRREEEAYAAFQQDQAAQLQASGVTPRVAPSPAQASWGSGTGVTDQMAQRKAERDAAAAKEAARDKTIDGLNEQMQDQKQFASVFASCDWPTYGVRYPELVQSLHGERCTQPPALPEAGAGPCKTSGPFPKSRYQRKTKLSARSGHPR